MVSDSSGSRNGDRVVRKGAVQERVLMLYDADGITIAQFDTCRQVAEYVGVTMNCVYVSLMKDRPFLDGRKVEWVEI